MIDAPYRTAANIAPRFVCTSCLRCSSTSEGRCTSCGSTLVPLANQGVKEQLFLAANRIVKRKLTMQLLFGLPFGVALQLLFIKYDLVPKIKNIGAALVFGSCVMAFFQPYLFSDRIGKRYRSPIDSLDDAFDVLGIRPQ